MYNFVKGFCFEFVSFIIYSCVFECFFFFKLVYRSKSLLILQWKVLIDNGLKIINYFLEWDEGKRNSGFRQCFFGSQKYCKLIKFCLVMGYIFRLVV